MLFCLAHISPLFFFVQRTVFSVAERIVVTLVAVDVHTTTSTVALVIIPKNGSQWLSTDVAQESARWFALVVQPLGCLSNEVG